MRNSIYEHDDWTRDPGQAPQDWQPGEPPTPYGDVPGAQTGGSGRRTPELWRGRREKQSSGPKGKRSRLREENGTGGFCLVLALLLILTGVAIYFQGRIMPGQSPSEKFWDEFRGQFGGWDRYYDSIEETDWLEDLDKTSIPLAPLDSSVTLELASSEGASLTPQEIYARVSPAVVGIRAMVDEGMYLGTGVVMTADGYIITNAHVIAGTQKASVIFSDNSKADARLVGYDGETDLAVLKVEREGLTAAEFGDSSQLRVGDPAYAIGNPLGEELRGTMTSGIISAIDRTVDMDGQSMTLLQTNAALNSGNSGGALINAAGQVVGITNMKMMSDWETIEGLGFAVPTSLAKIVVDQIVSLGYYTGRPALGITVVNHYDENGDPDGAEVRGVKKQSGASGKLFAGDVIVSAQDLPVTCTDDLLRIKDWLIVGEQLRLQVWTGEQTPDGEKKLLEISVELMRSSDLSDSPELISRRGEEE